MKDPEAIEEKELLREVAPTLFKRVVHSPVEPPAGYHEAFAERLQHRMAAVATPTPKTRVLHMVSWRNMAIAASVAAAVALVLWPKHQAPTALADIQWDEPALMVALEYVDDATLYNSLDLSELHIEPPFVLSEDDAAEYLYPSDFTDFSFP